MARVTGLSTSVISGRFLCVAILSAAGATVATSRADAALYDWADYSEPGFYRPAPPPAQARRQKLRQHSGKKDAAEKDAGAKPQGPLIIAVSIGKQRVKVYDARGVFAEAPVSTGMAGHSTPMGVFSVIQKHKLHHSNIYSNAPMPYMQRITWSGVALHAGVLPGYPASHGCIRMPMGFAVKMWNWTKMGARVVVTPGETTPASFSHPLLPAFKVAPQPVVAEQAQGDAPVAAKADKGAPDKPATSLELRSTVGHSNAVTSVANMAPVTLRDQTHTADAADAKSMVTMSDAGGIATNGARTSGEKTDGANTDGAKAESVKADTAPTDRAPPIKDSPASAKPDDGASAETKPTDAQPVMADTSTGPAEAKPDAPKQDQARVEPTKPEPTKAEPSKSEPAKADAARPNDKPAETIKAASDGAASAPDDKKDQSRLAKPEVTKRTGQIAVFISRKDSKIYVRQNFAPLFDAPVTIAASDRPLGTHVFTAEVDKSDANALHWSVVSLPMSARGILRASDEEYGSRQRKNALASAEAKPLPLPDSPVEALDRISVPADTMARISEALTTGGSIIVSDQGINQGETGEGTDFIVSLR
jgi:lipoprotein-anchoring transpeptidase ErfK/SrfK